MKLQKKVWNFASWWPDSLLSATVEQTPRRKDYWSSYPPALNVRFWGGGGCRLFQVILRMEGNDAVSG
jgi:hypothetical protein